MTKKDFEAEIKKQKDTIRCLELDYKNSEEGNRGKDIEIANFREEIYIQQILVEKLQNKVIGLQSRLEIYKSQSSTIQALANLLNNQN